MNHRTTAMLATFTTLPFGLAFLLLPGAVLTLYGVADVGASALLMGRYFGSALLSFAAAVWALRELDHPEQRRRVALAIAASSAAGLAVTLAGLSAGTLNAMGWSSVAIYTFFTLAWLRLALDRSAALRGA
jgi:hypothetical protein